MPRVKYCEKFEYMWAGRPKRSGPDSKANAYKAWSARVKEGYTEREMVEGLRSYGKHCAKEGKLGTPFVMQMQTFFGPALHFDTDYGDTMQTMELQAITEQQPTSLRDMSASQMKALESDTSWATGEPTVREQAGAGIIIEHGELSREWAL
ncbi:hypothetical protein N9878_00790 [bacterium]|nr:hypothetical protein [bacterium]